MKFYAIQQAGQEAHVYIFGDITAWRWEESDTSAWSLAQEIKDLQADVIHVHIDSYGGAVSEGWAIYNALTQHEAKVVTHADGFVASAAIYPFLAGEQRIASSLSTFYLHQAMISAYGNADELRDAADDIERLNTQGLAAFTDLGIDADEILELEKAESWLTPQEALSLGIATEIRQRGRENGPSQSIREIVFQRLTQPAQAPAEEDVPTPVPTSKNPKTTPENRLKAFFTR